MNMKKLILFSLLLFSIFVYGCKEIESEDTTSTTTTTINITTSTTTTTSSTTTTINTFLINLDQNCISENKLSETYINNNHVKGVVVVRFKEDITEIQKKDIINYFKLDFSDRFDIFPNARTVVVYVPKGLEVEWICRFEQEDIVEDAHFDQKTSAA